VILLAGAAAATLTNAASPSKIRFVARTHDALFTDSVLNQVLLLEDVTGAAGSRVLADATQGVSSPLDADSSPDRRQVLIVNSGAGNVLLLDTPSGSVTPLTCQSTPSGFRRLREASLNVISASDSDGFWLLDPGTGRLSFVPVLGTSR
jgi:hypothetical protein